ncbi:uncharacterized protein LOC128681259 isoform X2 [Plodia interpunctella]|nr:uncharacterized protein LOC128681259 isoform X2 [Plodia interpunctella]
MVETRYLIDAVHRRKCLWDRSDVEYRDRLVKDRAWKEIYKEMEPNYFSLKPAMRHEFGMQITKKWYNVRDSYVKSKRNSRSSRPYIYTDQLGFLDSVYFPDGNVSKQESFIEDKISNDDEAETSENWINEVFIDVDEDVSEAKRSRLDYTNVKDEIDDSGVNVVNVLANLIQREDDEDRAFFKSITPSVKMLSHGAKLEFRIQMLKLIRMLKMKDKKGQLDKRRLKDSDSE